MITKRVDWKKLPEEPYKPAAEISRKLAADGTVLLKNEGKILPLKIGTEIALFGRCQIDYLKSGLGSGGLVKTNYVVNIADGLLNAGFTLNEDLYSVYCEWCKEHPARFDKWNAWEVMPEGEFVPETSVIESAAKSTDTAVVVIGRAAGESNDVKAEAGGWYLTENEEELLSKVTQLFKSTIVLLNVGAVIDMSFVEKYNVPAVAYIWQAGQEGGNAVADVLSGKASPDGRLADTIAKRIEDYPSNDNFGNAEYNIYAEDIYVGYRYFETFNKDAVLYPFGFGLSYSDFLLETKSVSLKDGKITAAVEVKNIGEYPAGQTVQIYYSAPQGKLGRPARELCDFKKTEKLAAGESTVLNFEIEVAKFAAYDDSGITGNKSCYVLEPGEYALYIGENVRDAKLAYTFEIDEITVTEKLGEAMAAERDFEIMTPKATENGYEVSYKKAAKRTVDYDKRIVDEMPKEITPTGDKGIKLVDVKNGKNTMEEFVAQISDFDLGCLAKGEGMCSPKVRAGSTGAFGGTTDTLVALGVPMLDVHDGPSGLRIDSGEKATSILNGTAIACSWDVETAQALYECLSVELCTYGIDSLLGPGMNIHRSPLGGRNFEYFSEDPLLTGKIGAALCRGMAEYGNSATIKHFAANSQEFHRGLEDSVMSERAAREIYLKGFEIAVKEGGATSVMTGYNRFNGRYCSANYELNTTILKDEWGFKGFVMTDWWAATELNGGSCKNLADMIIGGNDVYMLTANAATYGDNIMSALESGKLKRSQLQKNAINILNYVLNSHTFERFVENGGKTFETLADKKDSLEVVDIIENLQSDVAYPITPGVGKHLFSIVCHIDGDPLEQMLVDVNIGFISSPFSVSGVNNGVESDRDMLLDGTNNKVILHFENNRINVLKLIIRK